MGGKNDSMWSTLGELADAIGSEVSGCIPGADAGQSSSPSGSSQSAGSGTHYGSDGSYSGSSSKDSPTTTSNRDYHGNETSRSVRDGARTYHYKGGLFGWLSSPTHYSIDRGNGVHDRYRYSDDAPVSRTIDRKNGRVDHYDAKGNSTGHTRK